MAKAAQDTAFELEALDAVAASQDLHGDTVTSRVIVTAIDLAHAPTPSEPLDDKTIRDPRAGAHGSGSPCETDHDVQLRIVVGHDEPALVEVEAHARIAVLPGAMLIACLDESAGVLAAVVVTRVDQAVDQLLSAAHAHTAAPDIVGGPIDLDRAGLPLADRGTPRRGDDAFMNHRPIGQLQLRGDARIPSTSTRGDGETEDDERDGAVECSHLHRGYPTGGRE